MARKQLKREDYERIVTERLVFGTTIEKVAELVGCGQTSVVNVTTGFKAVQDKDWQRVIGIITRKECPFEAIRWAAEKCGAELPSSVTTAWENIYAAPKEAKPAPPPPAPAAPDHWEEEKLLLQTLIGAVKQQNELLEQLYDVVLPKWVGDIKDNVNVNSDQQTQALKRIEGLVEAVKINTRRRGT